MVSPLRRVTWRSLRGRRKGGTNRGHRHINGYVPPLKTYVALNTAFASKLCSHNLIGSNPRDRVFVMPPSPAGQLLQPIEYTLKNPAKSETAIASKLCSHNMSVPGFEQALLQRHVSL